MEWFEISGLRRPFSVHYQSGQLYIVDLVSNAVLFFTNQMKTCRQLEGPFDWPHGVSSQSANQIFVTEYRGKRVKEFNSEGKFISTRLERKSDWPEWILSGPIKAVINSEGEFIVPDFNSNSVQKFSSEGDFIGYLGEPKEGELGQGWISDLYQPPQRSFQLKGGFDRPHSVSFDSENNLYVADTNNHRIQRFSADGKWSGWLGCQRDDQESQFQSTFGFVQKGESAASEVAGGGFCFPKSVLVYQDHLYVIDNHRIHKFTLAGTIVGWMGAVNDENGEYKLENKSWNKKLSFSVASAQQGAFLNPYDLDIADNKIYIADSGNRRIQVCEF